MKVENMDSTDDNEIILPEEENLAPHPMTVRHRLTMVQTFYHQVNGGDAHEIRTQCDRTLESDEQVYERNTTASPDPIPLDFGWLNDQPIALIVIKNQEPGQYQDKLLEVNFPGSEVGLLISPGEVMAFRPTQPHLVTLKALNSSKIKYTLFVVPG